MASVRTAACMRVYRLEYAVEIPSAIGAVFEFFADARNLEAITPPWLNFKILTPMPVEMREGVLIDYRIRLRGVPIRWRTRIAAWEPPVRFVDEQLRGPYRLWEHEHRFEPTEGGTRVIDVVRYAVPGWVLSPLVHRSLVRPDLERIFEYRRRRMVELLTPEPAAAR